MKILSNTERELREEEEKRSTIFFFSFSSKLTFNNNEQNDEYRHASAFLRLKSLTSRASDRLSH